MSQAYSVLNVISINKLPPQLKGTGSPVLQKMNIGTVCR